MASNLSNAMMEKGEPISTTPPRNQRRVPLFRWVVAFTLLGILIWVRVFDYHIGYPWDTWDRTLSIDPPPLDSINPCATSYWDNFSPKPYLDYTRCYGGAYQCARLVLPMDYWNGTTDANVTIAVIKKPAVVPVSHPQYGGVIFTNPGGPGGSGVDLILGASDHFRAVLDDADGKYFDLISFDPRGVKWSQPKTSCPTDDAFMQRIADQGVYSSSDAAFGRVWSMSNARSKSCSLPREDGKPDPKKYVNTAYVARDMLEIAERHGEWREKEAMRLAGEPKTCLRRKDEDLLTAVPEHLRYRPGKEAINYYGFSYGSYLGNTFAAMFPDRISRLVVDGVVDAYDYEKSLWADNLWEAEKALSLFNYHCARVGYPKCALANKTGTTTEEGVKARADAILASLYHNPVPIISLGYPNVLTYSDVMNLLFFTLYIPIPVWPSMANALLQLEQRDATHFDFLMQILAGLGSTDSLMAIACTDGDDQRWMQKSDFREHIANLSKVSSHFGEIWADVRLQCIHYDVRPPYRFHGPWIANTSHPILEVGNTMDPVTPGRFSVKMAKGFPGAGVLLNDAVGHCAASVPSNCTETFVRNYFQTGELPPDGQMCKPDMLPFDPFPGEAGVLDEDALQRSQWHNEFVETLFRMHPPHRGDWSAWDDYAQWWHQGI